jgi:hypothetical protein
LIEEQPALNRHSALEIDSALMYFDFMFEVAKAQLAAAADKASHLRRFL